MCRIAVIVMTVGIVGCSGKIPQRVPGVDNSMSSFPVINPDDPASIEKWESSEYNVFDSKIVIVPLHLFHGKLGDSTPKPAQSVALQVCGARHAGPSSAQQAAIASLVKDEMQLHRVVRTAIYDDYKRSYPVYKEGWSIGSAIYGGGDFSDVFPEIRAGNELDTLVQIFTIYIHPASRDSSAAIGIECSVPWDEEHDVGLRLSDGEVLEIGTAHVAYPPPQR